MAKRRWVRIGLAALLLLLAGAMLVVWIQRDLPRRTVARELASGFDAEVTLERLEILGRNRFLLHGVELREMAAIPQLVRLRAERVEVWATLSEILAGRYREVRVSGVEVELTHSTRAPVRSEAGGELVVERLVLEDGRLDVSDREQTATYDIDGLLTGIGTELGGEIRLDSTGFGVSPLLSLLLGPGELAHAARVEAFEARLAIEQSGRRLRLAARSDAISIDAGIEGGRSRISLPGLTLDGTATWDADGRIAVELQPVLPGIEQAEIVASLAPDGSIRGGRARIDGAAVETWTAILLELPPETEIVGRVDLDARLDDPTELRYELRGTFDRLRPPGAGMPRTEAFELQAEGTLQLGPGSEPRSTRYTLAARAGNLRLERDGVELRDAGTTIELAGTTELPSLDSTFEAELDVPALSGLLGGLALPENLPRLLLRAEGRAGPSGGEGVLTVEGGTLGRLAVDGTVDLATLPGTADLGWSWSSAGLEGLAVFVREAGAALPDWLALDGDASARGTLRGPLDAPELAGSVAARGLHIRSGSEAAWSVQGDSLTVEFVWPRPNEPVRLDAIDFGGTAEFPPLAALPVELHASGRVDPSAGAARLVALELDGGDLGRLDAKASWDDGASVEVALDRVELKRWRDVLRPLTGDPLPEFELSGSLATELRADWRPERGWLGGGRASITESALAHEDGSRVIQGAESRWEIELAASDASTLRLNAIGAVDGFVLLWGRVFGDYGDRGAGVELELETSPGETVGDWRVSVGIELDDGARLRGAVAGAAARPLTYSARVDLADLEESFRRWVHDPLADSIPALANMEAGGVLVADLGGIFSPETKAIEGRIRVDGGRLEGTGGSIFIRGLGVQLPVDLTWSAGDDGRLELAEGKPLPGRLEFERLAFGEVEFAQTATDLVVQADTIGLEEGLAVPLLGGVLGFEELILADGLRGEWHVESGVLLSGIRLDALSTALGILPLEGLAEGYFPRVRLTRDRLAVDGDGEFEVFGGKLTVSDISGEDVLSRFPKMTLSVELEEIDLLQVTHTFDFGELTGTLMGRISDCELFRWAPVRCRARFETVRRKDVPRTINVKAVSNIAILGTGGGQVSALDRGIHKFLDRYTYERIGVTMDLRNDLFVLRGLESRGSRELFLKGRLPFRIDVVNVQPGRAIAFRSMLDRIRRMEFADFDIR